MSTQTIAEFSRDEEVVKNRDINPYKFPHERKIKINALLKKHDLVEYIKDKHDKIIGVMIAFQHPDLKDEILVGYSRCSSKDRFTPITGIIIAMRRAYTATERGFNVPHSIQMDLAYFYDRCKIYYKDKNLPEWFESAYGEISVYDRMVAQEETNREESLEQLFNRVMGQDSEIYKGF